MATTDRCPHPLSRQDASALIGVLSRVEALVLSRTADSQDVEAVRRRLVRDGAMAADDHDVSTALSRLNRALRTALGEDG